MSPVSVFEKVGELLSYFIIDSDTLSSLLSHPLCVSVALSPSEEVQALRARVSALETENKRLSFAYSCSSALVGKFRDFCRDNGVSLPRDLAISTPWG